MKKIMYVATMLLLTPVINGQRTKKNIAPAPQPVEVLASEQQPAMPEATAPKAAVAATEPTAINQVVPTEAPTPLPITPTVTDATTTPKKQEATETAVANSTQPAAPDTKEETPAATPATGPVVIPAITETPQLENPAIATPTETTKAVPAAPVTPDIPTTEDEPLPETASIDESFDSLDASGIASVDTSLDSTDSSLDEPASEGTYSGEEKDTESNLD